MKAEATSPSFPAVASALDVLGKLSIAREITGDSRNRLFSYSKYLSILSE